MEFHLPQVDHGQPSNWLWPMKCRLEWWQNETAVWDMSPFSSSCHWNWHIPEGGGSISSRFPEKGFLANVNVSLCMLRGDMRWEQSDYPLNKVTGCYSIIIWAILRKSVLERRPLYCSSEFPAQATASYCWSPNRKCSHWERTFRAFYIQLIKCWDESENM